MSTIRTFLLPTAVVTGASGGIGAVYADRLARRGHDLVLIARNTQRLQELAARLVRETGRKVEVVAADLTARDDLLLLEKRLAKDARIGLLVNNAGFNLGDAFAESDVERLDEMVQLNAVSLTRLTRAAAPAFVHRGGGTIINIGSIVAISPRILNAVYSASKAYVLTLSQALQHEFAGKGLRVQVVLPGAIRTDFWEVSGIPVAALPQEMVMSAEDLVDAALAGLDQGEQVTIPSLPDDAEWTRFEATREALVPHLSRSVPAPRYRSSA